MPISSNELREKGRIAKIVLTEARSGDNPDNKVPGRLKWCVWGTPKTHTTRNISEICDECWNQKIKKLS